MDTDRKTSLLIHLECPECGGKFDADHQQSICHHCHSPLLARYDLEAIRQRLTPNQLKTRYRGLWRWAELLPVRDPTFRITLGEGDTPLIPVPRVSRFLGLSQLIVKDESRNPTGTFKARGLAVAVSRNIELGVQNFVIPTAGNAGAALATYAARAGCNAHIFMPRKAPKSNHTEVRLSGANLYLVDGSISQAALEAGAAISKHKMQETRNSSQKWFDISTFKEPYRLEGKKTMGLEIAESLDWQPPDVIIYPTGGGTGLVGIWKAFEELQGLGWIDGRRPRMVAVQAEVCAPIVRAFQEHKTRAQVHQDAATIASGLRVPQPFADKLILNTLYTSQGNAITVSDKQIKQACSQLAQFEGILAAPEGAATLAALILLIDQGWIKRSDQVLLINTGSGLKTIA